ncbi:helix-turn-helix domain-containing protein [Chroococcidiopsis sp.]|uniref:helix-turn-helix domain-containing protein n=1 Tax=Chroococcidiopsis sp. TaxID=3088168 RepID=UPI003F2E6DD2
MTKASHAPTRDPKLPIASSQNLGWESIIVEEFQQPPGGIEHFALPEHAIAVCLATKPNRLHQIMGDRRYVGLYTKGDISITPAHLPSSYQSEGEDCYLHIQIPPQFLQQVAKEAIEIDPAGIEIVPEFRVRNPQIESIAMMLRSALHQNDAWVNRLYVESLANLLTVHLLRDYATTQPRVALYEGGLGDRRLLQVSEYINAHLDREIKLADLAQLLGMSQFHFSRLFKQSLGSSPHQYLLQQRVERAKQLLKQTNLSVVEIALQSGFNSHSHLSQQFRQFTGMTPKAYRAS